MRLPGGVLRLQYRYLRRTYLLEVQRSLRIGMMKVQCLQYCLFKWIKISILLWLKSAIWILENWCEFKTLMFLSLLGTA